jgi:tetratricopeptide (TPR) repeat protein
VDGGDVELTPAPRRGLRGPRSFALAAVIGLVSSLTADAAVVSREYEALLRRYARGERTAAVSALGDLRAGDLDQQVKLLQRAAKDGARCPSCPDPLAGVPLKAAVMLHSDRDEAERPPAADTEQPRLCPGDHARRAGQIAALLAMREPTRDFARRFYLSMAQRSQWDFCLEAAAQWGAEGLERFPRDPELLLVMGAIQEENASLGAAPRLPTPEAASGPLPRGRAPEYNQWRRMAAGSDLAAERRRRFVEARRLLSEALAAAPTLIEARLRLGRVQWQLGEDALAAASLEQAVRLGGPAPLPYLAYLFLGQVRERAGQTGEAVLEFEKALEIDPEAQAPAVALSHVLLMKGDGDGARRALVHALARGSQRKARDAYWNYPSSNAADAGEIVEALREETRE